MQDIRASALTPVDLWALPTPDYSRWFAHLDWYLNWQMCTGLAYSGLHLPVDLYRVAAEHSQSVPKNEIRTTPLLVSPRGRLPAERAIVLDGAGNLVTWLVDIAQVANNLRAKSIRIFLPTHTPPEAAQKEWPRGILPGEVVTHFVPDLEAAT